MKEDGKYDENKEEYYYTHISIKKLEVDNQKLIDTYRSTGKFYQNDNE